MASSDVEHWQCDKTLPQCMAFMLDKKIMCDVTFLLGEERVEEHAHKYMLASRSPVFRAMLDGPPEEIRKIEISDMDIDIFRVFLRFVYTDDAPLTISNVCKVMDVSKRYCVDLLTTKCINFLRDNLSYEGALELLESAFTRQDEALYKFCLSMMNEKKSVRTTTEDKQKDGNCIEDTKTVYFHASPSSTKSNIHAGEIIVFDKCTTNQGQGYNPGTGIFTAPKDGAYVFTWTILTNESHRINVHLMLQGRRLAVAQADSRSGRQNGSGSNTVVVNLRQGDELCLKCGDWGHANEHRVYGDSHSTFSGWTIH